MKNSPTVIDLYSGIGGLSLGAARAGFRVAGAVETDQHAISYHAKNFPNTIHLNRDVGSLTGDELLQLTGLKKGGLDGLIGGPPCQGFSVIGKRRIEDDRNNLFVEFFRLVKETMPRFFVAENVPGILMDQYASILNTALGHVKDKYRLLGPIKVKANLYGAPTTRTRVFFIGYDPKRMSESPIEKEFLPASWVEYIQVGKALKGLPVYIHPNWQDEASSWQKTADLESDRFFDSVRDRIPVGVGCKESIKRLFEKSEVSGFLGTIHRPDVAERYKNLKPGELDSVSNSIRLDPAGFCPTLRAGTGKEKGSFQAVRPIHFSEPRVITPREAARLQGFPDWFVFHPTKWHSFRQIGNSVSPIVSEAILGTLSGKI